MTTFPPFTHALQPQPALDSVGVLRELEALLPQWPSDLQRSFLQLAKYLTGLVVVVPPDRALPLAGGTLMPQKAVM